MTPEEKARVKIDQWFADAGWKVVNRDEYEPTISAVAIREGLLKGNLEADYFLFINGKAVGVLEAKREEINISSNIVSEQAITYAKSVPDCYQAWQKPLPFLFKSNGKEIEFFDYRHRETSEWETISRILTPKEIVKMLGIDDPFAGLPTLNKKGLRECQYEAVTELEKSFRIGQNRALMVLATGAGKTYTACLTAYRMLSYTPMRRVLFLVDRNNLGKQAETEFGTFRLTETGDAFNTIFSVNRLRSSAIPSDSNVVISTIQRLFSLLKGEPIADNDEDDENEPDKEVVLPPNPNLPHDFFDLIIIDECHRSIYGNWRKVLEYFSSATQIGMTATPKADEGANNLDYFGEPVYTYSLLQGIQDGFLAPYRVTADFINVDLQGWTPDEGEIDLLGKEIEQKLYQRQNIGRDLAIKLRRKVVAHRITQMLYDIGRMTKTIVFCSDIEEAAEMRTLLINMNSDLCKKSPYYVTRIVGEDKEGKKQLDNFISVDEPYPVIVTTSELLSTGVDCKTCGLIVIDKEIGSMTEFKQIIGRGTRLRKDKGKWHLEILDFRNATAKFKDPSFDGDPEPPKGGEKKPKPYPPVPSNPPTAHEPREKYLINGKDIRIAHEIVSVLGEDGKTMRTESVQSFARKQLLRHYQSLDDFVQTWTEAERKQAVMDELKEYAILIDAVREANPALKDADIFDVICHVAFDQPPLTRKERANNIKKRNYFGKYEGKAREVLEALLDKYAENGILDFEKANILEIPPFNSIGKPTKIIKLFGGKVAFEQAIRELEYQIYKSA